jgi:hypothetical protein
VARGLGEREQVVIDTTAKREKVARGGAPMRNRRMS